MSLPPQFKKDNIENIFIYHYVEEMISNYGKYIITQLTDDDITRSELPFLLRIRFGEKTTQKELVELFKVSEGYTAKILRKFEDKNYIKRYENPDNHRIKIVKLTPEGIEITDKYIEYIRDWENKVTSNMSPEEVQTLKKLLYKVVI
ncbi:MAG: MarR family winged helix-turn-helix transcriptional regulator [Methanosphaera sp.]|uniref:MarR family winged helix-turn-helix transcriptional regulator n=1 Tax=Methanosphaera sp. TaxID=2666342 RepID=UPI002E773265|nr:MarR family winged helix-turn-helix transcriptional regulator [Methanosphaera sp.]MEE1117365.1 MarR family winged helix-turn-helix transcriptional regulator [Methanosphaera sp.]MEE3418812.1 MarR family winged helix-turn-helix transcriptional regulator [Methanosphaera sp.]